MLRRGQWSQIVLLHFLGHLSAGFLALRVGSLTISVVAARKYRNKHFYAPAFAQEFIDNLQFITDKINIHLLTDIMLDMSDCA